MTSFASLSIHNFVNSVGAYVGLGSIIAVALLVLLYFAHARETATLRDRLDDAQQRIGGLEARIGQLMQAQAAAARRAPGAAPPVVPAPSPVRPGGVQSGAVRRVPSPATVAAGATAAGLAAATATPNRQVAAATWAPAGTAAPALASATKVIPDRAAAGSGDPDDTIFVPAAAVAATNGQTAAARAKAVPAPPTQAPPTQALPVAAASARTASASPRGAVASPPRMQIATETAGAATAATAAAATAAAGSTGSAGTGRVRRIGGNKQQTASAAPILPAFTDEAGRGGRFAGRVLPLLIGGIAVIVIIAGLIVITNAGSGSTTGQVSHGSNSSQTGAGLHKQHQAAQTFNAANETVAVLNGTAQAGLAGDVGTKLAGRGFKKGNITNGASQTQGLTFVYYVPGAAAKTNKVAAQHVAKALALSPSRVRPAGGSVRQSCAISPTGTSLGSCNANVIVSVGQDRENLASGGSSG
jgi:LytR cell envelope-related transcriptional attenuator